MLQDEPEEEEPEGEDLAEAAMSTDEEEDDGVNFAGKPKKRLKKSNMFVDAEAEASTDEEACPTLTANPYPAL